MFIGILCGTNGHVGLCLMGLFINIEKSNKESVSNKGELNDARGGIAPPPKSDLARAVFSHTNVNLLLFNVPSNKRISKRLLTS